MDVVFLTAQRRRRHCSFILAGGSVNAWKQMYTRVQGDRYATDMCGATYELRSHGPCKYSYCVTIFFYGESDGSQLLDSVVVQLPQLHWSLAST